MTSELRILMYTSFFVLGCFFVNRLNKGKKRYDLSNTSMGPGQFFDVKTYKGNMRFMVFSCLTIFGGRHIDEAGQWLWRQFGKELVVTPEKAAWHALVALTMGMIGLVVSSLRIQRIYNDRQRQKELRHKIDDK